MNQSEHFNLNLVEGTDKVNPLTQDVPNYEAIDAQMFANQLASIGTATELVSGTVHAITRTVATPVFRFTATSNFVTGETFVVDGEQVTALTPSGETLPTGCYVIGSEVLCVLRDTLLTVYVTGVAVADNALKLGGELPSYYATAEATATADGKAVAAGTVANTANGLANTLNGQLTASGQKFYFDYKDGKYGYNTSSSRGADTFHPFKAAPEIHFSNQTPSISFIAENSGTCEIEIGGYATGNPSVKKNGTAVSVESNYSSGYKKGYHYSFSVSAGDSIITALTTGTNGHATVFAVIY